MSDTNKSASSSFSQGLLYAAIGSALSFPMTGLAQNSDVKELEAISITGSMPIDGYQGVEATSKKITAPLLDTPKTINIIPEEVIKDRGATSLQDVLRSTPGITLGSGEGGTPTGDRPFIRGYEASTDIFIDGMRDYARGSHETFNLEAVEVIKGPSSAYTGRGGTGGSINLSTKKPSLDNFFEGSAGYGTDSQYRLTADGNYAFSDTAAFRLNLMKMGGGIPGRDHVKADRWGIAPSISFGLGTPTRVTLSYSRIVNKDTPDMGIPFSNAANPGRTTPIKVDRKKFYGRKNVDFRKNTFDTATATFEHDISNRLTVSNSTRYGKSLNHYLFTRPSFENCVAGAGGACASEGSGLMFQRDARARYRKSESLINQTDIFGSFETGSLIHNFVAGVEFSKEEISSKAITNASLAPLNGELDSFWNPNPKRNYSYSLKYEDLKKDGDIKTRSFYLFDTIDINDQWSVNAGLRYDQFKVHATQSTGRGGVIIPAATNKNNMWNYQAGIVYKPAYNGSIYLSYGTSSNPSGENLGQAGGADGPASGAAVSNIKPEKSRSWELGTKWDVMDERLSLTAAVFETKKTNARTSDPLTGDVTLSGSNRVRGLELSANGAVTPKWDVWAGYTYLDPKVTSYRSGNNDYSGNKIKFISKHSATLWNTYKIAPQWTLGGGVTYVGKRYVNDENTLKLPSHTVYDAMVRYDVNKNLSFQLNGNNLSNARVYDASHVGLFANVGPGRSFMLTASYRYE